METNKKMKRWKLSDLKFIRENLHLNDRQLAECFGVAKTAVEATRIRNGIIRPKDQWGFRKGSVPFNKGKKLSDWMGNPDKSIATRFKKGNTNHNSKFDGFISIRNPHKERNEKAYKWIRISKGKWKQLHVLTWENIYGKVPENHIVVFKNGDTMDCSLENLELITRAENLRRNINRTKGAQTLKKTWAVVKTFEDFGLQPPYKFKSKKKSNKQEKKIA